MKARLLRQRLSVSAPRMTVRSHVPMGAKIAIGVVAFLCAVALGGVGARSDLAQRTFGDPNSEVKQLQEENRALREDHDRMLEASNTVDSNHVMERSMIKEMGDQIARLEADNTRLKEDVAFFEAATADRTPNAAKDANGGIAIRRFQVTQDRAAHVARYRILLTQDSKANRDFTGELQLVATVLQGGKAVNIIVPGDTSQAASPTSAGDPYAVVFKSYKRIDGTFGLPVDAVLKSVLVRILEKGVLRGQQSVAVAGT